MQDSTLFIDFDGTLVDMNERSYFVYRAVAKKYVSAQMLSKEQYWNYRRKGFSFTEFFKDIHGFYDKDTVLKEYLSMIEDMELLKLDKKIKDMENSLKYLKNSYNLVLISLRRKTENFYKQLKILKIHDVFDEIFTAPSGGSGVETKITLIQKSKFFRVKKKYIVGDTEIDMQAGNKIDVVTIAICTGMRDEEFLKGFNPKYLIKSISQLPDLLNNISGY